ncbi:hypothetical protein [Flavobacterium tibetense]|jgi:hypothetical protein|uniref:Uncharacterized protein n=1 Tax=Flavobacterium tibetense TaxID=2233533 RepID=A0A365P2Z2_9FLAO|nr:hypothetical protein [Flavobacterium tibetense]RBA28886.1 hypothetical protein DPN68_05735 [Flavobacterium tibetense]
MNKVVLLIITLVDLLMIGIVYLTEGTIEKELLIGLFIFFSLFILRILSNQIFISNGNNKKN